MEVNNIKDYAVILLDREGCVQSWNKGAEMIKGYKTEEVVGKHFSIFYTKKDIQKGKPKMELRIAKEKGKCEEEGVRVREDGSKLE